MKINCGYCEEKVEILVTFSGPHLKATCVKCGRFIKFLNKTEKKIIENEEDELNG